MATVLLVQIKDANGDDLTKVLSGETVKQGKQRILSARGLRGGLETSTGLALDDDDIVTADNAPYTFREFPSKEQQQPESMLRFRSLLASKGITPSQPVMMQLVKHFASSVAIVSNSDAEIAAALYYSAARIPRSATELVLKDQGISVAQPFQAADPSKAILLHAFRDGHPMILKVSSSASTKHEADVIDNMMKVGGCDLSEKYLCPIERVQFASSNIELTDTDTSGSISTPVAGVRLGLLMKHYQTTLAQCKIPLTANVLLRYGNQLKVAISHMHQMGYCHLDIKPANIFLLEGDCFLGDYGAATKIGLDVSECTRNYYPTDFPHLAETKTDFLLLAKTLMEMFGAIQSPVVSMSTDEILEAVETVKDQSVKDFLQACFGDDQAAR